MYQSSFVIYITLQNQIKWIVMKTAISILYHFDWVEIKKSYFFHLINLKRDFFRNVFFFLRKSY